MPEKRSLINGFWGRVLEIDVTTGEKTLIPLDKAVLRLYIGGSSLGTKLLYDHLPLKVEPYAPDNLLIFSTGPFQSTSFPGSAKWMVISKSPLTGTLCVSGAGARFGPSLKSTGFDAVILRGKASKPVYIVLTDAGVEVRDASSLWGRDALETNSILASQWSHLKPSIATIGQAGERGVAIACIVTDGHSYAGRGGLGAVMGSKKLKAVVVSGSLKPPYADPEMVKKLTKAASLKLRDTTKDTYHKHGTANDVVFCESIGDLPIKYWAGDRWEEGAKRIGAPRFTEVLSARPNPCQACPIGCHRAIDHVTSTGVHITGPGPEYESLGLLGSACLVNDLDAIALANDVCNRLGIDTISAGSFVAFSMECHERGWLEPSDVDGLSLKWGDGETLVKLVDMIGRRQGFGELFAKGIRNAAKEVCQGAEGLAVEVKGMDLPAHDPRTHFSLAINYATSTQGASHLRGFPHCGELGVLVPELGYSEISERFSMKDKPFLTKLFQDYAVVLDSLVDCCFMQINGLSFTETTEVLNAITGLQFDPETLIQVGERGFNLQRLLNLQDGLTGDDDRLPARMFEPASTGPRRGKVPKGFEGALAKYYQLRGWTPEGVPTAEKLKELHLYQSRGERAGSSG